MTAHRAAFSDDESRYLGKGNGSPLPYSCLESPMDRGAWWATVHGVERVRQDLATKPPSPPHVNAVNSASTTPLAPSCLSLCIAFHLLTRLCTPQASLPEPLSPSVQLRSSCEDHCPKAWFHSAHFWTVNFRQLPILFMKGEH